MFYSAAIEIEYKKDEEKEKEKEKEKQKKKTKKKKQGIKKSGGFMGSVKAVSVKPNDGNLVGEKCLVA
ncbi:hypothetical protein AAC387_Pa08g2396 [Persea americana]